MKVLSRYLLLTLSALIMASLSPSGCGNGSSSSSSSDAEAALSIASTYYVDVTNGNDANKGTSESTAWKTTAKVNTFKFQPGDQILFKRGGIWREQLVFPSSGLPGNPIVISAYGTGTNPIISGAYIINNWKLYAVDLIYTPLNVKPNQVFRNNIILTQVNQLASLTGDGMWFWDSTAKILYVRNAGGLQNLSTIEVSQIHYVVWIRGISNVVIKDLIIEKDNSPQNGNIYFDGDYEHSNITISNCEIRWASQNGIFFNGTGGGIIIDGCEIHHNSIAGISFNIYGDLTGQNPITIRRNKIHHNTIQHGINVYYANYINIEDNVIYSNGDGTFFGSGISCAHAGNINISRNLIYDQMGNGEDGNGISIDIGCDSIIINYNICYNNDASGITVLGSTNVNLFNNVSYANGLNRSGQLTTKSEIRLLSTSQNHTDNLTVKNNVAYGTRQNVFAIYIDAVTASNNTQIGTNDWYTASGNWWLNGYSQGSNITIWNEYPGISGDINADPLFRDLQNYDFHLKPQSPCIGAGSQGNNIKQDFAGALIPQNRAPDIGAYVFQ